MTPGEKDDLLLSVDRVSKLYARRTQSRRSRLAEIAGPVFFGFKPEFSEDLRQHEFWAVDDVSFDLRQGEAVGIIGLNGSGKTTLLRMLAGQILPDKGEIRVSGSSAAMIDLQAGFQQNASGRQNIFLRSAALGFTSERTNSLLNEIIEFSELGDAIDAPMATFSSGMKMRLAFSVMATVAPDVLFIDEVLAVGDFRFRQKCLGKIREMRDRSAFVFVSHSMGDIERFCDRVLVLNKGRRIFMGAPREAIEIYESLELHGADLDTGRRLIKAMGPLYRNDAVVRDVEHSWRGSDGAPKIEFGFNDRIRLAISFTACVDIRKLSLGVPIWNENAQYTSGISSQMLSERISLSAGERASFVLDIDPGMINPGTIRSLLTILDGVEFLYREPNPDIIIKSAPHPTWGAVTIPHRWRRIDGAAPTRQKNCPQD